MSKVSIFDLPHILELIGHNLPWHDILSSARVCYSWNQVFEPLAWRNLELGAFDYTKLLAESTSLNLLADRAPTVHSLTIRYAEPMWAFLDYIDGHPGLFSNNLTRLTMTSKDERSYDHPVRMLLRWLNIAKDHLEHLDVSIHRLAMASAFSTPDTVQTSFLSLRSLRSMALQCDSLMQGRDLAVMLRYCPESLEFLRIECPIRETYDPVGFWRTVQAPATINSEAALLEFFWQEATPTNIQTLQLPCSFRKNELTTLIPFLRLRCPKLTTWDGVPLMRPAVGTNLAQVLSTSCLQLEDITFHDVSVEMLALYPLIIRSCHGLKSLTITGKVHDAKDVVQAVTQSQARTITRIRWTGSGGFHGRMDMEEILRSCSSLERLETTFSQTYNFFSGQGAAGAMWIKDGPLEAPMPTTVPEPSSPYFWACGATLTHLDVTFCLQKSVTTTETNVRDQVELTYRKLGQLCALVQLRLGCRCRCYGRQLVNCKHFEIDAANGDVNSVGGYVVEDRGVILDMSLDTGLAHLAGLRMLRSLSIGRIQGHRIGYAELEWMQENWPALQYFGGVRNMRIVDWVEANWPSVRVLYMDSL
ncbi:hypothetical protein BGZ98_006243 [Dissophora globulifera]|nr:hypothetical protein BGZ98_006243 [Dissophora globulifera]